MEQLGRSLQKATRIDEMRRRFVVVSGLPGSGKSTLARRHVEGWHNSSEASPTPEQTKAALEQHPSWVSEHARVARADIGDVKCLDPSAGFDPKHRDDRWRNYVRERFVEALQGDHNMLLLAQVFAHYHPESCKQR